MLSLGLNGFAVFGINIAAAVFIIGIVFMPFLIIALIAKLKNERAKQEVGG